MKTIIISDDYAELNFFTTIFSKLGLTYETVSNPKLMAGLLISFNPQLIIVSGKSKKFDGIEVLKELKRKSKIYKFIFLKPAQFTSYDLLDKDDVVLDSPVVPRILIQKLAELGQLDYEKLESKLQYAASGSTGSSGSIFVKGAQEEEAKSIISGKGSDKSQNIIVKDNSDYSQNSEYVKGGTSHTSESQKVTNQSNNNESQKQKPSAKQAQETESEAKTSKELNSKINPNNSDYENDIILGGFAKIKKIESSKKVRKDRYQDIVTQLDPIDTKQHIEAKVLKEKIKFLNVQEDSPEEVKKHTDDRKKFVDTLFTTEDEES